MAVSSRRSLFSRLIDSDDDDGEMGKDTDAVAMKSLPTSPKPHSTSLRDFIHGRSAPPPPIPRTPIVMKGSRLGAMLDRQEVVAPHVAALAKVVPVVDSPSRRVKRTFASLFSDTDSSEAEESSNIAANEDSPTVDSSALLEMEEPYRSPFRTAVSSSSIHVGGKLSRRHSFNTDVRPQMEVDFSQPDAPIECPGGNGIDSSQIPSTAARFLKNYQVIGTRWLWGKYVNKMGGILGDDMGLGKTIQVVSFLLALFNKTGTAVGDKKTNRQRRRNGREGEASVPPHSNPSASSSSSSSNPSASSSSNPSASSSSNPSASSSSSSSSNPSASSSSSSNPSASSSSSSSSMHTVSSMRPPPCLIVCPASVVANWDNELSKWGYFLVDKLGSPEDVSFAVQNAEAGRCEIVLGSYSKLRRNIDTLCTIQWSVVIWDEGHCLKGDKTRLYEACQKLTRVRCRFILSGTPIQNKLEELWALLNMLNRGVVQSKEAFKEHFVDPIKTGEAKSAHPDLVRLSNKRQRELQKLVNKYMLQRFKEVELSNELKSKEDIVVFCALTSLQSRIYQHLLSLPDFENCRLGKHPCPCESGRERKRCCSIYSIPLCRDTDATCENFNIDLRAYVWRKIHRVELAPEEQSQLRSCIATSGASSIINVQNPTGETYEAYETCRSCPSCISLPCINVLLKVASHPLLFQVGSEEASKADDKMNFLKYCLKPEFIEEMGGYKFTSGSALSADNSQLSGKMQILEKLLANFTKMRFKTLLFSYSTKMLSIIENYIKGKGWAYLRLDGSTPAVRRQPLVDQFNNTPQLPLFLISTRAGGMGLNLTSATKVIIFDCSWNPTVDMQAQDRCYRYGQTKQVTVYRLIAQGTVEELIYMRQLYKQALQLSAMQSRPEIETAPNEDGPLEGGLEVRRDSQEDADNFDEQQSAIPDYIARKKRLGEGKRAFYGIEGQKNGELFGLENLMQYESESILGLLRKKYAIPRVDDDSSSDESHHAVSIRQPKAVRTGKAPQRTGLNTLHGSEAFDIITTDARSGQDALVSKIAPPEKILVSKESSSPARKNKIKLARESPKVLMTSTTSHKEHDPDFMSDEEEFMNNRTGNSKSPVPVEHKRATPRALMVSKRQRAVSEKLADSWTEEAAVVTSTTTADTKRKNKDNKQQTPHVKTAIPRTTSVNHDTETRAMRVIGSTTPASAPTRSLLYVPNYATGR